MENQNKLNIITGAWLFYAILFRVLLLLYFLFQAYELQPERIIESFIIRQNDYYMLLGVVDNFFTTGVYEVYANSGEPFAGRLPGYSFPYLILQWIFGKSLALKLLIIFQILFSAIAALLAGKIVQEYTNSKLGFIIGLHAYLLSGALLHFDLFTLSESFSFSALVTFFFFWNRYQNTKANKYLLLAGLFLAWAIFLRPFLGLLLPYFCTRILWTNRNSIYLILRKGLIFISFFIFFESAWIIRNYIVFDKLILLQTSLPDSYGENGIYNSGAVASHIYLVRAFGGDNAEFRTGSEAWWFLWAEGDEFVSYDHSDFVQNNLCFSINELQNLAIKLRSSFDPNNPNYLAISKEIEMEANSYIDCIQSNYPYKFFIRDPAIRASEYFFSNPTYLMPLPRFDQMSWHQKLVKLGSFAYYHLAVLVGLIFLLFNIAKKNFRYLDYLFFPISITIALVYFGHVTEPRYSLQFHFIFILLFSQFLTSLILKLKKT